MTDSIVAGKICPRCPEKGAQPLSNFHRHRSKSDGLFAWCKACVRARDIARGAKRDKPGRLARKREERATAEGKRRTRDQWLRRRYGLTLADYERLFERQGGCCAICGARAPDGEYLHVDHCHTSGRVRSLLCKACNTAIGLMCDDPARLLKAVEYLRAHAARAAA